MRYILFPLFFLIGCSTTKNNTKTITEELSLPDSYELPKTEILTFTGNSFAANFHPKAEHIIFHSQQIGHTNLQIYELNIANKIIKRISHQSGNATFPKYHPKGPYILYQSTTDEEKEKPDLLLKYSNKSKESKWPRSEIYTSLRDGSGIIRKSFHPGFDGIPTYSTNKHDIYFSRKMQKSVDLIKLPAKSRRIQQLTKSSYDDLGVTISPDNQKIAWQRKQLNQSISEIYIMNIKGRGAYALTSLGEYNFQHIQWHPDSRQLIFSANLLDKNNYEIFSMNINEKCIYRLSYNTADDIHPSFHPDGKSFVFSSNRTGSYLLYQRNFQLPKNCIATVLPRK